MAKTTDYKTLIEAVERYVQADSFPKVEVICAILGIPSVKSDQDGQMTLKEAMENGTYTRL